MLEFKNEVMSLYGLEKGSNLEYDYEIWEDLYNGNPYWLNDLPIEDKRSLNLAPAIVSELARLSLIEFKSEVSDENLDKPYQDFLKRKKSFLEQGLALGGVIVKPYKNRDRLEFDIVNPAKFIILGFTSMGEVNHIVFIDRIVKKLKESKLGKRLKDVYFTRLEEHIIDKDYTIKNRAFMSESREKLGDECSLSVIEEWQGIAKEDTIEGLSFPLFAYFRNPTANNLDLDSYEGVSCYARAISLMQDADEQYQRIMWEYRGSELAIDADVTALEKNGQLPKGKERLFRNLGLDMARDDNFYEVFSPDIRDESLFNGLNKIIEKIEFHCGLAYGSLSEAKFTAKTATEIKQSNQRSYTTVVDIQNEFEDTMEHFVKLLKFWFSEMGQDFDEEATVSFNFDDSLVVDSESEQKMMLAEVAAGIISPETYIAKRYGIEDEEKIRQMRGTVEEKDDDIGEEE